MKMCTRSNPFKTLLRPLSFINKRSKFIITPSKIYNYMNNDCIVDWIKLYGDNNNNKNFSNINSQLIKTPSFTNILMDKGIDFESNIIKYINDNIHSVYFCSNTFDEQSHNKTVELMKQGVPIIHSASVINKKNNTGGIIDLLVRSDFLDKIIKECPLSDEEKILKAKKLSGNYHYVVIDIKFSTLYLRSDGIHLLNQNNVPAYKSQLYIYNEAIGSIQGYTPSKSYLLGRKYKFTKNKIQFSSNNCFEKLGVVNFADIDLDYKTKTKNAISWFRDLKRSGHNWSISPPIRKELFPNMCVDSGYWNKYKKIISNEIDEITKIWMCGPRHRENCIEKNIFSWSDENCNSKNLGLKNNIANIVDRILNINRQTTDLILPKKIESEIYDWRTEKNNLYIDFETVNSVILENFKNIPCQNSNNIIFLIGVGFIKNNKWVYKKFLVNNLSNSEELRIIKDFKQYIDTFNNHKIVYFHAENTFWEKALSKHNLPSSYKLKNTCDVLKLFKDEPIVLKNCFDFSLKNIAKTMKSHNMISTSLETDCKNGFSAMVNAIDIYSKNTNVNNNDEMKDIIKYNEFDCKILYDILTYLRKNH